MTEKGKVKYSGVRVVEMKAEWKRATKSKTVLNIFVALFRPLAKTVEKERINGNGCPQVLIFHNHGVETPRNKQQVAKRQWPTLTKLIEYLEQEAICDARDSDGHIFRFKKVTKLKPKMR